MPRRSAAEAAATRDAIVGAAREAFSVDGYAGVTLEGIARAAGVTRGAVHHHFSDKRALFVEVFRQLEYELNDAVVAAARTAPPAQRMRAGCEALFNWFTVPAHRQITLGDAPGVLGLDTWYEIDRGIGMPTMRAGIQAIADLGLLEADLVEPVTVLLYGALTEAALVLGAGLTDVSRARILDALELLVTGMAAGADSSRAPT